MDVRWGYNNIRIKDGDTWKAAFQTNRGLFEPLVMFFGLTNSPATFQTMMNDIFREEIAEGWVVIYMDDILVFSKDKNEHQEQVKRILEKLRQHQLSLKAEKCYFEKEEIEFLGLIISEKGIRMDPHKVKAITDWPIPTTKRELQQFLGFVNFYRRFVKGFTKIAKPLTKLTGKTNWLWTELQQKAFQELKNEVTSERVLIIPKPGKPFRMETDASDFAIAAILSQLDDEGKWRPVAFLSRSLNDAERNYEIYDKEMLAIMHGFCQISKPDRQPRAAPLQPNEIPSEPWAIISIDLIRSLIPSKGKDMILVIVDRFSKKAYFLPCNTTITSQGVANLYRDHIFKEHGLPKKVISDRGSQFVSGFIKGLYQNLGIKANPSTAYHPQTDGQTERVNQELEEYLRIYVNERQNDWVD
jgi:hypothetical protein